MNELLIGLVASFALHSAPCEAHGITNQYDLMIKAAVNAAWTPEYQNYHCVYKAQLIVESGLKSDVVSPVGAQGIAQFLPKTWEEITRKVGVDCHPYDAPCSIVMGAAYMNERIRGWSAPRSNRCRLELAQASYNAGFSNILKMQKASGMKRCWGEMVPYAEQITGKHAAETKNYIKRIWKWYDTLRGHS